MKRLSIIGVLCCMVSAYAQDALPPLPDGPLLKRMPNNSVWSVTTQGALAIDVANARQKAAPADGKTAPSAFSKVTKSGSLILEQNIGQAGKEEDIWHVGGLRLVKAPAGIMILHDSGGGDIYSINFSSEDFAGLDWISPQTYIGIKKYSGRDCIIFKSRVSPLDKVAQADEAAAIREAKTFGGTVPELKQIDAVAYIDAESRVPLYAQFGPEKRFYQYQGTPSASLSLPAEYVAKLGQYAAQLKIVQAPAGKP